MGPPLRVGRAARTAAALVAAAALAVAGAALVVAGAGASGRASTRGLGVAIQAVFTAAGNPSLVANFSPDGALATPYWSICPPAPVACRVVRTARAIFDPGPEPGGTRFTAIAPYRGHTYRSSVTWHGRVRALTPPRLIGEARFGAPVSAAPGTWTGGWGTEFDQLGLEACRPRGGQRCITLSGGQYGCPARSWHTAVGGALTGWYLVALDLRSAPGQACAGVGYSFPAAIPAWPRHPIVARSVPVGPVVGPPAPSVAVLRQARVQGARVLIAAVRCPTRCHAWLEVFDRRFGSSSQKTFTGRRVLGVPRRSLRVGPLSVRIHVGDGPVLSGRSRLRRNGKGAERPQA